MEKYIHNVSDTSFWIAGYRAQETERKDAVFKDTLAKKLAGQKGIGMVVETPNTKAMAYAMVMRTSAIDRLVTLAVSEGVDTVINLGAGLDTRPYRLQLPEKLNWIEVDFEGIINYKNEMLLKDNPVCNLKRISFDLSNIVERRKLFSSLAETSNALIITEGVIGYLTNESAAQLSEDIYNIPSFRFWIGDYSRGKMRRHKSSKELANRMKNTAPILFTADEPVDFFGKQGWIVKNNIYILDEAERIGRKTPPLFPWNVLMGIKAIRKIANTTYGYVMFGKA